MVKRRRRRHPRAIKRGKNLEDLKKELIQVKDLEADSDSPPIIINVNCDKHHNYRNYGGCYYVDEFGAYNGYNGCQYGFYQNYNCPRYYPRTCQPYGGIPYGYQIPAFTNYPYPHWI